MTWNKTIKYRAETSRLECAEGGEKGMGERKKGRVDTRTRCRYAWRGEERRRRTDGRTEGRTDGRKEAGKETGKEAGKEAGKVGKKERGKGNRASKRGRWSGRGSGREKSAERGGECRPGREQRRLPPFGRAQAASRRGATGVRPRTAALHHPASAPMHRHATQSELLVGKGGKRQERRGAVEIGEGRESERGEWQEKGERGKGRMLGKERMLGCLLYTSDAADDM
eukprot:487189-Rhodomonas_salina.1